MATSPQFISTPKVGVGTVVTANTARDGTGTIVTIFTAGSSGSKINEVVLKATDNPADSCVVFFLYDGSTYHVFDEIDIGDPAAGSTTVASYRTNKVYDNLVIASGWSFRASITVAPTGGNVQVFCLGGDF